LLDYATVSHLEMIIFLLSSFTGSFISAAMGLGGGVLLLSIMTQFLPALAVIPVHGAVQLGSNVGRAGLLRRFIDKKACAYFALGSLLGALIGGKIVFTLNADYLRIGIALFILFSVVKINIPIKGTALPVVMVGGGLSTILTMFVGATGPFVAALLKIRNYAREQQVATMAACMVIQHFLKILVFVGLGFQFANYAVLIAGMIVAGFIGTHIGKKLLIKINEQQFRLVLNAVLIILSIRLLWQSFGNILEV